MTTHTKDRDKKNKDFLGGCGSITNGHPEANSQDSQFKEPIFYNFFFLSVEFGKEGTSKNFYLLLSIGHYGRKSRRADLGKNSYFVPSFIRPLRIPSAGSRVSRKVLSLLGQKLLGQKNTTSPF